MLILKRDPGERVFIGEDIVITVLVRHNGEFRIGIEAPRHIPVMREELRPEPTGIKVNGELIYA